MSARFELGPGQIDGVQVVTRKPVADTRGSFVRLYCPTELHALGFGPIAQINHSVTRLRGSLRGMHLQKEPYAEAKLVSCIRGTVFDVAVDARPLSKTYRKWHGEILSAENGNALFIPPGCAHGFQTLTDDVELIYLHSAPYQPEAEAGINALDPSLAIAWPIAEVAERSARDLALPRL